MTDIVEALLSGDTSAALRTWRDGLVNLTRSNRALNFRPSKTGSVPIEEPSLHDIFEGLRSGRMWSIEGAPEPEDGIAPPRSSAVLRSGRPDKDLAPVVRGLMRRARQEFLDRGLSVMYLALGMLHWTDEDGSSYVSPLLLVPVELIDMGPKAMPRLRVSDDGDPTMNPALALRLTEFSVTLPSIDELEEISIESVMDRVRESVSRKKAWQVSEAAVLAPFSFLKEAMYRDLKANEAAILEHPVVQALANQDPDNQNDSHLFESIPLDAIDEQAPPEKTPLVLDADSSQRICVAAAVAGHSFVMDGPPGTGKSQTIANMIGALLHAGKTVLFVSEKAAALEVVRNRLAHAGLGNYLLELHSHKASRKEVADQLAHALDNVPMPPPGMDAGERSLAADRRRALNAYARAMNVVRQPLGSTLHDVLGRLSQLDHVPAAPRPGTPPVALEPVLMNRIADATSRLSRAWRPASQGFSFLWRDVVDRNSLDSRLYQAESALEELDGVARHNERVSDAFGLRSLSSLRTLDRLLILAVARPTQVPDPWLTLADLSPVRQHIATLHSQLAAIRDASAAVRDASGMEWHHLPSSADVPGPRIDDRLQPPLVCDDGMTQESATAVARQFAADAAMLEGHMSALQGLAARLGVPRGSSLQDVYRLLDLAEAAYSPFQPQASWLTPSGLAAAQTAQAQLKALVTELDTAESSARRLFTDSALNEPLSDLHERFTNVHKGLRKLFGDYRRDKKSVAAFTNEMVSLEEAISDLGLAVKWSDAAAALSRDEGEMAGALGTYWKGRDTDFTAIQQALDVAQRLLNTLTGAVPQPLIEHVSSPAPDTAIKAIIDHARRDLDQWRSRLAPAPAHAARPELVLKPLAESVTWLRAHAEPLSAVAARTAAVDAATSRSTTLTQATHWLSFRDAAAASETALTALAHTYAELLGDLFAGTATDEEALDAALRWVEDVRACSVPEGGPLTDDQAQALALARPTENLSSSLDRWDRAQDAIVGAFAPSREGELGAELNSGPSATELLAELRADSSGQEEWFQYQQARADLAEQNLDETIEFCIAEGVDPSGIGEVVERAVLRAWADHLLESESDLRPIRAEDRAALIAQYRDLDERLIPAATGDIIRAVNSRRPASVDVGQPAIIRREGMKKKRHIAVRDLIRRTAETTLAIKPCFMMSPLAVSQYLPSEMRFDVVVFDEASQVTPGDAINCVYRGHALVTAGDDKQLPPTSFFDRMADDESEDTDVSDFQSVLELAKASGAFRNLGLNWHYRSRHEDLIAFSNHKFYEGKLITFPGARSEGEDVGVQLVHVDGVYRRGTGRDNPLEAEKVVDRVVHHFDTRPDTSLGVVTFSLTQADAIQSALDRRLAQRPDLSEHLEDDRLSGFFIKSLESVQGDERDVMIFSIGYGADEHGKVTTNFGALNKAKGWRRLNVAITRARQRVEIVSSIRSGDIPDSTNENVRHLAAYLDYAERGTKALALELGPSGLGTDSPFEDSVIDAVRSFGYAVEPQVGAAGYRIDIGVRHPTHPGVYAIGIECDGAIYHSSPAARDRDRLREQVLVGLGWRLHRIWGTAWYRNRAQEVESLRAAIEDAIKAPVSGRLSGGLPKFDRPVVTTQEIEVPSVPAWAVPYNTATLGRLPSWANASDPSSRWEMIPGIEALAHSEGPVHIDVALQRMREAWNIGRVGLRIRVNIESAISQAQVAFDGRFIDVPDRTAYVVRVPAEDGPIRSVEHISDQELSLAVELLLKDAGASTIDELMTGVARIFGWNRRGPDITSRLSDVLETLLDSGVLSRTGETLRLRTRPTASPTGGESLD